MNTFPTWHRAYLLLFEVCSPGCNSPRLVEAVTNNRLQQVLHEIMVNVVIKEFPEDQRKDLVLAADKWRLPYWDWASKKPVLDAKNLDYDVPQLVRLEAVKIRTGDGLCWVKNPLYAFKMPGNVPMSDGGVHMVKGQIGKNYHEIHVSSPPNLPLSRKLMRKSLKNVKARADIHQQTRRKIKKAPR